MIRAKGGLEQIDVAILGGGPAGLQAALVLSRTRKKIVVFDDPEPPRNAASHGVHNFIGFDGLLPDKMQQTNIKGLYAAGDFQNPFSGALEAAYTGGMSAFSIVHEWY